VEGAGYSYAVPDGWEDVSDDADDEIEIAGMRPDSLVAGEPEGGFAPDVNVVREGGLPPGVSTAQYADVSLAGLRDPAGIGLPQELVDVVDQLDPHDFSEPRDSEHTLTLTVRPDRFDEETDALDEVVESWDWEG
jgi:hypothetical protein